MSAVWPLPLAMPRQSLLPEEELLGGELVVKIEDATVQSIFSISP